MISIFSSLASLILGSSLKISISVTSSGSSTSVIVISSVSSGSKDSPGISLITISSSTSFPEGHKSVRSL